MAAILLPHHRESVYVAYILYIIGIFWHSVRHIYNTSTQFCRYGGMLFCMYIYCGILCGMYVGALCCKCAGILSGILFDIFWHSAYVLAFYRHSIWHSFYFTSGMLCGIFVDLSFFFETLSGTNSDRKSGIRCGFLSGMFSGILSGIVADTLSVTLRISQFRPSGAHCDLALAVEDLRCPLRFSALG